MATYDTQRVSLALQQLNASGAEPLAARDRLVKALRDGAMPRTRMSPVDEAVWADDVINAYNDYFGCVQSMFASDEMDAETRAAYDMHMKDLEGVVEGIEHGIVEPMGMSDALDVSVSAHGRDGFVFDADKVGRATASIYVENLLGTVGRDYQVYMGPVDPNTAEPLSARGYCSATELVDAGISPMDALTHLYDTRTGKMAPKNTALKMIDAFAGASANRGGYVGGKQSGQMPAALERELLGDSLRTLGADAMGKMPSDNDSPLERASQMAAVDRLVAATDKGSRNPYARWFPNLAVRPTTVVECVASGKVVDAAGRNVPAVDALGTMVETRSSYKGVVSELSESAVKRGCDAFKSAVESVKNSRFAKFCANTMAKVSDFAKQTADNARIAASDFVADASDAIDDVRMGREAKRAERHAKAGTDAIERLEAIKTAKEERLARRRVPDVAVVETEGASSEYGA